VEARYISEIGGSIGLAGDDYQEFESLVAALHRSKAFASTVTPDRLEDAVFDWFLEARVQETPTGLCDYLLAVLGPKVRDWKIVIPIAGLRIEQRCPIGKIELGPVPAELIDSWITSFLNAGERAQEERTQLSERLQSRWRPLQGYAAGFMSIRADHSRAQRIALKEAEAALEILRFFAPENFASRSTSYCVLRGRERGYGPQSIAVEGGNVTYHEGMIELTGAPIWEIRAPAMLELRGMALDAISGIYRDPRTHFRQEILDALLLYSRVSITRERSEKLVILLAALESLLLKDDKEAPTQNLGERMALLIGNGLDERKRILATTREIYAVRSGFIHHGRAVPIEKSKALDLFMQFAWVALRRVLNARDAFTSRIAFLESIDDRKLAWQPDR
jgi:hypothetical protein